MLANWSKRIFHPLRRSASRRGFCPYWERRRIASFGSRPPSADTPRASRTLSGADAQGASGAIDMATGGGSASPYCVPRSFCSRPGSKPTTVSPSITRTGVVRKPRSSNSWSADSSLLMFRSSYSIPFSRRNSFARLHPVQPFLV